MKFTLALSATTLLLPAAVLAAGPPPPPKVGWSGSGEVGFAAASGNTRSENLNAKVNVKYNDDRWKNEFNLTALRNKGTVAVKVMDDSTTPPTQVSTTHYQTTADRVEAAASAGYKLDDHSYLVGASRYERDEFSAYDHQAIGSIGYGYQVLKSARNELAFEVGAGYKSVETKSAANPLHVSTDSLNGGATRGKIEYKHSFNANTSFSNVYLVESTSGNTFVQNDAGLQVKMTDQLGLKAGYEIRHSSDVLPGFKSTDQLLTTNLVYSF